MKLRPFTPFFAMFALLAVFPFPGQANVISAADSAETSAPPLPDAPSPQNGQSSSNPPATAGAAAPQAGHQTKRILYIVPNFRAVSSDQKLPPQSVNEKLKTVTLDSVDYSSFIFVGAQAGLNQSRKATPEFRQGAVGYGRYFWHTFADTVDENLWVEFLLPVAFRQDSRFYTLSQGGPLKKLTYSASRVFITRADSGRETVNVSEILGAGVAAGISNTYYPNGERSFTKVYQRWITSMAIDGGTFVFKQFWPVLNDKFFHQKD